MSTFLSSSHSSPLRGPSRCVAGSPRPFFITSGLSALKSVSGDSERGGCDALSFSSKAERGVLDAVRFGGGSEFDSLAKHGCIGLLVESSRSFDKFRFLFGAEEPALEAIDAVGDEADRAMSRRDEDGPVKPKERFCLSFRICVLNTASTIRPAWVTGCGSPLNAAEFEKIKCTSFSKSARVRYLGFCLSVSAWPVEFSSLFLIVSKSMGCATIWRYVGMLRATGSTGLRKWTASLRSVVRRRRARHSSTSSELIGVSCFSDISVGGISFGFDFGLAVVRNGFLAIVDLLDSTAFDGSFVIVFECVHLSLAVGGALAFVT